MNSKTHNYLFVLASLLLALVCYWPSMHSGPVWDDITFLFQHHVIAREFSWLKIWKDFSWPMSVSLQKIMYNVLGENYFGYHLTNFLLHLLNSVLLLRLARRINLPYPRLLFLIFLFHPSNVISVAWMIQFKTVTCFTFAILACDFLDRSLTNKRWMPLAWLFYAFSLLCKTASLPLSTLFAVYYFIRAPKREFVWILPFLIMAFYSGYRILNSPVTQEGINKFNSQSGPIAAEAGGPPDPNQKPDPKQLRLPPVKVPYNVLPSRPPEVTRSDIILQASHHYFWQTITPVKTQPVKGILTSKSGFIEYSHLVFLALILIINWLKPLSFILVAGYVMLSPFLGILPAPYMNLTWVSDQHLYLALPFFLCFWLWLLDKWKNRFASYAAVVILLLFITQSYRSMDYYKDEIAFFGASLEADNLNVPIAYNLALAYLKEGKVNEAMNLCSTMVQLAEISPEVLYNRYYPYIFIMHLKLNVLQQNPYK